MALGKKDNLIEGTKKGYISSKTSPVFEGLSPWTELQTSVVVTHVLAYLVVVVIEAAPGPCPDPAG